MIAAFESLLLFVLIALSQQVMIVKCMDVFLFSSLRFGFYMTPNRIFQIALAIRSYIIANALLIRHHHHRVRRRHGQLVIDMLKSFQY